MAALEKHPDLRLQQNNPSGKDSPFFTAALLLVDPVSVSLKRHMAPRSVHYQKLFIKKPHDVLFLQHKTIAWVCKDRESFDNEPLLSDN